jgi:hypothetical protein
MPISFLALLAFHVCSHCSDEDTRLQAMCVSAAAAWMRAMLLTKLISRLKQKNGYTENYKNKNSIIPYGTFYLKKREYRALLFCLITSYYFQRVHILAKKGKKKHIC